MASARNVLWIMCDQLRFDYLSTYGHPHLHTPNIDALARRGVRFTRAYVQSPVCGPSRMSFYTGRYMRSHGANWNRFPLRVGEPTLGDHLAELGVRNVLVGKTHMEADTAGMQRLGIDPGTSLGVRVAQCGFEPFERDDGLNPDPSPRVPYDDYLQAHGFGGDESMGTMGQFRRRRGWRAAERLAAGKRRQAGPRAGGTLGNAVHDAPRDGVHRPGSSGRAAMVPASFLYQAALALYRSCTVSRDVPARRTSSRRCAPSTSAQDPHPVYGAFMASRVSRNFARDAVREQVDSGVYGADQADRRPDRRADAVPRGA